MRKEILLMEDDESLSLAICLKLTKEGYTVYPVSSPAAAYEIYRLHNLSLIICDIELPDGNGLDFCTAVKMENDIMLLFLTSADTEMDILRGYAAGADDYLTKPISLTVLVSKVHAIMKRCAPDKTYTRICSGPITLFINENRAKKNGDYLILNAKEQKLLSYFMQNPMRILSKNQLRSAIWDIDGNLVDENTLAVNIRRLREKIEDDPSAPAFIKNVRGLGYIWEKACEKK